MVLVLTCPPLPPQEGPRLLLLQPLTPSPCAAAAVGPDPPVIQHNTMNDIIWLRIRMIHHDIRRVKEVEEY